MQVTAVKTFLNSHTRGLTRAGDTVEVDDQYGGDLHKRGLVVPAGQVTSASVHGAVPQPAKTAAMAGAPFVGSKSLAGAASASSSSGAAPASPPKTVGMPAAPAKR